MSKRAVPEDTPGVQMGVMFTLGAIRRGEGSIGGLPDDALVLVDTPSGPLNVVGTAEAVVRDPRDGSERKALVLGIDESIASIAFVKPEGRLS